MILLATYARVMKGIVDLFAIILSDFAQIFHVTHRPLRCVLRVNISMSLGRNYSESRLLELKQTV